MVGLVVGAGIGLAAGLLTASGGPSPSASAGGEPTPPASTGRPSPGVSPSPSASPTHRVPEPVFPTRDTTGVPAGWQPKTELTGDQTIWDAGTVVEDLRLTNGVLYIRAPNVTLRRVEVVGGRIVNDYGTECANGLLIEDSSILRGDHDPENPAIEAGGYTARRLKVEGPSEGLRVGEKGNGCGPVVVEDSWLKIDPPDNCVAGQVDWHGDGVQGYQGPALTIRNSSIQLADFPGCTGTAAFFYPDQGNTTAVIENVLVAGGGFVFRLGTPGSVTGLKVVDGSWDFGAVDIADCGAVEWGPGNETVTVDEAGRVSPVDPLECVAR